MTEQTQNQQDQTDSQQTRFKEFLRQNNNQIPLSGSLSPESGSPLSWTAITNGDTRELFFYNPPDPDAQDTSPEFVPQSQAIPILQKAAPQSPAARSVLEQLGQSPTSPPTSPPGQPPTEKEPTLEQAIADRKARATPQQLAPSRPAHEALRDTPQDTRIPRTPPTTTAEATPQAQTRIQTQPGRSEVTPPEQRPLPSSPPEAMP